MPPSPPRRPLIVRLCNWIGDVVLSLPALELLAERGHDLVLYGKGWAPTLLSGYPWPVHVRAGKLGDRVRQLRELALAAGGGQPVQALAMPNSFSSALEMRLAGLRVAGVARDGRGLLLSKRLPEPAGLHALEHFLGLAAAFTGAPATAPASIGLRIHPAAQARADALVQAQGWQRGFVCIAPFAAGTVHKQDKRWPHFPALVERLAAAGHTLVICPGPGAELAEARSRFAQAQVVEDLPLDAYAALLGRSRLVVANDTGPGHLAAGVGAQLLSVIGPTKVAQWRAWGPTVELATGEAGGWPDVGQVVDAALRRLA